MSDLTIPARLLAESVGPPRSLAVDLPDEDGSPGEPGWMANVGLDSLPVWTGGFILSPTGEDYMGPFSTDGARVDLSDPQTAFGCALKLDEWERARDPMWPSGAYSWARRVTNAFDPSTRPRFRDAGLNALIARLRVIGEDAMIRRALGWEVEAGSLAEVYWHKALRCWMMKHPSIPTHDNAWAFYSGPVAGALGTDNLGALAGITYPNEARTAIWREVCGG